MIEPIHHLISLLAQEYAKIHQILLPNAKDTLGNLSAVTTLLGLSLVTVFTAVKSIVRRILRLGYSFKERRTLKDEYDVVKTHAINEGLFVTNKHVRLLPRIRKLEQETDRLLRLAVKEQLHRKLERVASGSSRLTYGDLLRDPSLLLPITLRTQDTKEEQPFSHLIEAFEGTRAGNTKHSSTDRDQGTLLIGSAGWGKSLACLVLEETLTRMPNNPCWVFTISAEDFWDADVILRMGAKLSLGSEAWCVQLLCARIGWETTTELKRRSLSHLLTHNALILIDGLDEIAGCLGETLTEILLDSWLIRRASLLTARSSFYSSSLFGHPSIKRFQTLSLIPPNGAARHSFIEAVCLRLYATDAVRHATSIAEILHNYPMIEAIVSAPLLLLMLAEIIPSNTWSKRSTDSIHVYEEFVTQVIDREAHRRAHAISSDSLHQFYQEMAWKLFEKTSGGSEATPALDLPELRQILTDMRLISRDSDFDAAKEAILTSPLVVVSGGMMFRRQGIRLGFAHESFQEFYVARRTYSWLTGTAQVGAEFFSYLETPGVSAFLKEYLTEAAGEARTRREVTERLESRLRGLVDNRTISDEGSARSRSFTAGQIAYYLGMIVDISEHRLLYDLAARQDDFWVRRCATVGLAFAGYPKALNKLIDDMRAAIAEGDFRLARQSIAIDLAFYGDQRFDPIDPLLDRGGDSCERLVTRVCHEMCSSAEAPYRRMGLFDILYLSSYREASKKCFDSTLAQNRGILCQALDKMEQTSIATTFPELNEARNLLNSTTNVK